MPGVFHWRTLAWDFYDMGHDMMITIICIEAWHCERDITDGVIMGWRVWGVWCTRLVHGL